MISGIVRQCLVKGNLDPSFGCPVSLAPFLIAVRIAPRPSRGRLHVDVNCLWLWGVRINDWALRLARRVGVHIHDLGTPFLAGVDRRGQLNDRQVRKSNMRGADDLARAICP